ncbi:MAG TPA: hypothetical protein VGM05_00655 [Planctomycetaceae bacterium]|jgi:hypothetical protein
MPRAVFTFDASTLENLKQMTRETDSKSMAETLRNAINGVHVLGEIMKRGYTTLIVRNPDTQKEETVVIEALRDFLKFPEKKRG